MQTKSFISSLLFTCLIPLILCLMLALSACMSISSSSPKIEVGQKKSNPTVQSHPLSQQADKKTLINENIQEKEITLEQIMADHQWMGHSPQHWYWASDSESVFYQQKRINSPLYDLYQKQLPIQVNDKLSNAQETNAKEINTQGNNGKLVPLSQRHLVENSHGVTNLAGTQTAYIFSGNVFVKTIATGEVKQLTDTSAIESSPMFLNNGNIAYQVEYTFFEHNLTTNLVKELAHLKIRSKTQKLNERKQLADDYLAEQQKLLIEYIALQERHKKIEKNHKRQLRVNNKTVTQTNFYFANGYKIVHASLSPSGNYMIVSITEDLEPQKKQQINNDNIMPNYIVNNAKVDSETVRERVSDNQLYHEVLYLLDLSQGTMALLDYDTLPGFDEDVLAEVRIENYRHFGHEYRSKKSPRYIHVMAGDNRIQWQKEGQQVAIMLEAWDNKDRWLATVNLSEKTLINQHRLHDDAWVNYDFNQFGWLNNALTQQHSLYYLSEQSGYSHIYVKALNGKSRQLTNGEYEVSQLTLSSDEQYLYFKANRQHPGIYEIYRLNLISEEVQALTELGGNNNYALSPNGKKLLIEHSTLTMPEELYVKALLTNEPAVRITHTVSDPFLSFNWHKPSVVAIDSTHQDSPIYSKVYLPESAIMEKAANQVSKNKAVVFIHGAGYLQNSDFGWSGYFREFMFHSLLVQRGYVVLDMDYRASKGYGRDWRTAIYRHMGKPEIEDIKDGVNWLVENANVDRDRIGVYGGSYGGFLTLMAMFNEPDLFQAGSALRLVSDWTSYEHEYTSNILNTPGDDPIAYERSSPIYFAEGLKNPLLMNAPMVDDNVFFQDTVRLVQRLIELEKEDFETAIYPVEPHGFVQPSSWLDEYRRILKLFEQNL